MPSIKKTCIIAEIGQAHDGSLGILHSYIDALADTGIDAIKFQMHIAEAESSMQEPFRINFSYEDDSRFDYWKRMSFTQEQWKAIKLHCEEKGLEFLCSPFSIAAVDALETLGVKRYKIGSGETNNLLMIRKIAQTGKPIILSSGMSSFEELDTTVAYLENFDNQLSIMQCTTSYPTPSNRIGFNVIGELKQRYPNIPIGLSEHTARTATGIAAVALGAELLEFHVVFDRRIFGPDTSSSLTIDDVASLVKSIRFLEEALSNPIDKNDLSPYFDLKRVFEKTLAINKDLPSGHELVFEDLEAKKPAKQGIAASKFESILGKKLTQAKSKYDFLKAADLYE